MRKLTSIIYLLTAIFLCACASVTSTNTPQLENITLLDYAYSRDIPNIYKRNEFETALEESTETLNELMQKGLDSRESLKQYFVSMNELAISQSQLGFNDQSLLTYKAIHEMFPTIPFVLVDLGIEYTTAEQYAEAESVFLKAIELMPDSESAKKSMIKMHFSKGDYADSYRLADELLNAPASKSKNDGYIRLYRALAAEFSQLQSTEGMPFSKKREWPAPIEATINGSLSEYGLIAFMQKNAADEDDLNGMLCEALFYLGAYAESKGNVQAARNHYEEALRTNVYAFTEYNLARKFLERLE